MKKFLIIYFSVCAIVLGAMAYIGNANAAFLSPGGGQPILLQPGGPSFNGTNSFTGTNTFSGATFVPSVANPYDFSTQAINHSDTVKLVDLQMATLPISNITSSTYSFDTVGTGAQVVLQASGGVINNIITWASLGSGYAVGDLITPMGGNYDGLIQITAVSSTTPTAGIILYGGSGYGTGGTFVETGANAAQFTFLLQGNLTAPVTFIMPYGSYLYTSNQWFWANNTTGNYPVTICQGNASDACSGGRTVTIPQGTNNNEESFISTDGILNIDQGIGSLNFIHINGGITLATASSSFTTGAIGGGSLTAGTCASTTTALDSSIVTSTSAFITTPKADPGADFYWETVLIASSSVSTRVCAAGITGTPNSTAYNVKIIQ